MFEAHGVSAPHFYELNAKDPQSATDFHKAIGDAKAADDKHGAAVTQYEPDEYKKTRMFLTPDGNAGFALKGKDIVSVFNNKSKGSYRNVTLPMMQLAVNQGGRHLDAFDTALPHLYSRVGFVANGRTPFNDVYKPEGWKYENFKDFNNGRPDVVAMHWDPTAKSLYNPGQGKTFPASDTSYDDMIEASKAMAEKVQANLDKVTPAKPTRKPPRKP